MTTVPKITVSELGRQARIITIPINVLPVSLRLEDEDGQLFEYKFATIIEPGSGGVGSEDS